MPSSSETILNLSGITDLKMVESPEWFRQMRDAVNDLIIHNFNELVQLLYRVDVNEQKLTEMLRQHPAADAADMITALLLERQLEKIKTRSQFPGPPADIPESDKW